MFNHCIVVKIERFKYLLCIYYSEEAIMAVKKNFENYDVICFDMWQTIAETKVPTFLEMARILNTDIKSVVYLLQNDGFFLQRGGFENIQRIIEKHFAGKCDQAAIKKVLDLFKEAPKKAYITEKGRALLEECYESGKPLVLISNVDQYSFEVFPEREYLDSRFDRFYLSYELGMSKPDLRIFEKIRRDYDTKYSKMLFIGDDNKNDKVPAERLGIDFILVE